MPSIAEVGIGGVIALLILKEVFSHLKSRNGKSSHYMDKIHDLWVWHSPDQDGEQGWKGKNLERALHQSSEKICAKLDELKHELRK